VAKSIFTPQYDRLRELLVQARKSAGLTQSGLAECLRRPQSYVSKYERGERRLDVVEFLEIAKCMKMDGPALLSSLENSTRPHGNGVAPHGGGAARSKLSK
jgi:transcriptional regulator with XRE-family HTH domain